VGPHGKVVLDNHTKKFEGANSLQAREGRGRRVKGTMAGAPRGN